MSRKKEYMQESYSWLRSLQKDNIQIQKATYYLNAQDMIAFLMRKFSNFQLDFIESKISNFVKGFS